MTFTSIPSLLVSDNMYTVHKRLKKFKFWYQVADKIGHLNLRDFVNDICNCK